MKGFTNAYDYSSMSASPLITVLETMGFGLMVLHYEQG